MSELVVPRGMAPHPEGGSFVETWRSPVEIDTDQGPRASATAIAYLLQPGESSAWHRVRGAGELWLWQGGGRLRLQTGGTADRPVRPETTVLGPGGQHLVAPDEWQRAEPEDEAVLVACVVSPGFDFADLELQPVDLVEPVAESAARTGPLRVLVVCEGNVHRSPMAAALLLARLADLGITDVEVTSAGVRTEAGMPLQPVAIRALDERGVAADDRHRSRPLTREIGEDADLLLAATLALRDRAVEQAPGARDHAFAWLELLALSDDDAPLPDGPARERLAAWLSAARQQRGLVRPETVHGFDVPDPIGQRQAAFTQLAERLDESMTALAGRLGRVAGES